MKKVLPYLIPFCVCSVLVIVILATRGAFVKSGKALIVDLCDGFSVSGIAMLGVGLLVFVTNGGAFDMIAFGVIKLVDLFKRDLTKVKYRTFYDYRQAQQEKKRSYLNLIIVGTGFLIVGFAFLIAYRYM
ncbi:MAG: DUF3899 domain-containing protein [Corallococcus sp.]|nr:DUF3899 domain-containing protein [Bacillota bacterium]MCM1533367.1 DUF3899 domain-containing protein [Corallococcus sp.]